MGKGSNYGMDSKRLEKLEKEKHALEMESRKIRSNCSHQKKDRLNIVSIDSEANFRCKECGEKFNMRPVTEDLLRNSIKVVKDVINQIRCYSSADDDSKVLATVGSLSFNIEEVLTIYSRIRANYNKGRKGKKRKYDNDGGDSIGSYGTTGFTSERKKRKY